MSTTPSAQTAGGKKPAFRWDDPLSMEAALTEEERAVQQAARDYAMQKLRPRVRAAFREEQVEPAIFKELGALRLLAPDYAPVAYGLIARELERVDSGYRTMMSVQSSLVMYPIHAYGSETQKQKYLPPLASGALIGCFGLTEPTHGSDPGGMLTRAVKRPGGYALTGAKAWISHAPIADVLIVWAKTDDGEVRGFILEKNMAGLSTPKIEGKLSLRVCVTGNIEMQDVFAPDEALLPNVKGLKGPFGCLNKARYGIAWGALGAAEACLAAARAYTLGRAQFGRPLAANQLIQIKLADMQTEIALGLQACLQVGRLMAEGRATPEMVSMIKRNSCGKALAVARVARDMLGANGVSEDFDIMRHMANLETVNTYEGTHDMHGLILGRALTGIPAF